MPLGHREREHRAGAVLHRGSVIEKLCRCDVLLRAVQPQSSSAASFHSTDCTRAPLIERLGEQLYPVAEVLRAGIAVIRIRRERAQMGDIFVFLELMRSASIETACFIIIVGSILIQLFELIKSILGYKFRRHIMYRLKSNYFMFCCLHQMLMTSFTGRNLTRRT